MNKVAENVYVMPLGMVNVFLIDYDGLTLIDTGIPGMTRRILSAVRQLGRQPGDLRNILITHLHADHTGSLAAIKNETGAAVWMHAADAAAVCQGIASRPSQPAPGWVSRLLFQVSFGRQKGPARVQAADVEHEITTDQVLPVAGGIQAIHTPGHTAGHLVYLWPQAGVLFTGDAVAHWSGIGHAPIYEDYGKARDSQRLLAGLEYTTLCFSHGRAITGNAVVEAQAKIRQMAGE